MKSIKRYCPECDCDTSQKIELIQSGGHEGMMVYICNRCGESIGFVEDEMFLAKTKHLWEKKS